MKYTVTMNKAWSASFLERILVHYIYIITISFTATLFCYFCAELTEIFDILIYTYSTALIGR